MQKNKEGETGLLFTKSAYLGCRVMLINSYSLLVLNDCGLCLCFVELFPCFTEEAAAASVPVVKGAFVVVVKKGEITADISLNEKQVGLFFPCNAGNLHFSCLFHRTLMISITYSLREFFFAALL